MHVDVLKLDMKFLSAGEDDARSRQILASIIAMAVGLHMDVIAEGVETQRQADALAAIGCRYMQGYYYGKPMPQSEFEALLRAESAKKAREIHESGINSKIFLNAFYKISTKISTRTVQNHVFLTEPTKFSEPC